MPSRVVARVVRVARVAAVVCVVAAAACAPTVEFDVPITGDTEVPAGSILEQVLDNFGFDSFTTMDISQTQEFQEKDTRKDQVTSTKLTQLTLSIQTPVDGNFDWLTDISFVAKADGLDSAEVAKKDVPQGISAFNCDIDSNVDLAPFVKADKMSITTDATAKHPPDDTTVHIEASFHVVAQVLASGE